MSFLIINYMQDLIRITPIKLKVKDVFNLKDLILVLDEWLTENEFTDLEGNEYPETVYTHKLTRGGTGLDIWMWWRLVKYPIGTTNKTSYLRYLLNIDMHFLGDSAEIEVMHKGKKVKLNKGEIEIILNPFVEIDFRNEWKKGGFLGLMNKFFKERIYKKEIEQHWFTLYKDAYKLQSVIKRYFGLEALTPEETVSMPPKSLI